jgi:hypothetical protein
MPDDRVLEIPRGDLLPVYVADARTCDGQFSFIGWTLTFRMIGPVVVTGAATGDEHGVLTYAWVAGDTDLPGDYEPLFVGISPAGKPQTFRVSGIIRIVDP